MVIQLFSPPRVLHLILGWRRGPSFSEKIGRILDTFILLYPSVDSQVLVSLATLLGNHYQSSVTIRLIWELVNMHTPGPLAPVTRM